MDHLLLQIGFVSSLKPLVVAFLCHVLFDMLSSHLPSLNAYHLSFVFALSVLLMTQLHSKLEYDLTVKHRMRVFRFKPLEKHAT